MLKIARIILVVIWFFGVGLLVLPIFVLRPFNLKNGLLYTRLVMDPVFKIIGVEKEVRNREGIMKHQPCIYIMNHQHTLDVFVFGSILMPNAVTIGKRELVFIPIFGWLYWLSGHLLIDRKNHSNAMESMKVAEDAILERKLSVIIFPEGTRSWGKGVGKFKKGAFHLASHTGVPLVPIVASTIKGRIKLGKWRAGRVLVEALEPISTKGLSSPEEIDQLLELAREKMSEAVKRLDQSLITAG